MEKYGLTAYNIIQSCKKVIKRKWFLI
jgi:hypothetical protein